MFLGIPILIIKRASFIDLFSSKNRPSTYVRTKIRNNYTQWISIFMNSQLIDQLIYLYRRVSVCLLSLRVHYFTRYSSWSKCETVWRTMLIRFNILKKSIESWFIELLMINMCEIWSLAFLINSNKSIEYLDAIETCFICILVGSGKIHWS